MRRIAIWSLIYLPALALALPAFAYAVLVWGCTRHRRNDGVIWLQDSTRDWFTHDFVGARTCLQR